MEQILDETRPVSCSLTETRRTSTSFEWEEEFSLGVLVTTSHLGNPMTFQETRTVSSESNSIIIYLSVYLASFSNARWLRPVNGIDGFNDDDCSVFNPYICRLECVSNVLSPLEPNEAIDTRFSLTLEMYLKGLSVLLTGIIVAAVLLRREMRARDRIRVVMTLSFQSDLRRESL